jgi:hypothetical protein
MAIRNKNFSDDASQVFFYKDKLLQECTRVLIVMSGVVKEVWSFMTGYLFTSDGYVYQTSDEYFCKCSDQ